MGVSGGLGRVCQWVSAGKCGGCASGCQRGAVEGVPVVSAGAGEGVPEHGSR